MKWRLCDQFKGGLINLMDKYTRFFEWMYKQDGHFSDSFLFDVCQLSCAQTTTGGDDGTLAPPPNFNVTPTNDGIDVDINVPDAQPGDTYDIYQSTDPNNFPDTPVDSGNIPPDGNVHYNDPNPAEGPNYYRFVRHRPGYPDQILDMPGVETQPCLPAQLTVSATERDRHTILRVSPGANAAFYEGRVASVYNYNDSGDENSTSALITSHLITATDASNGYFEVDLTDAWGRNAGNIVQRILVNHYHGFRVEVPMSAECPPAIGRTVTDVLPPQTQGCRPSIIGFFNSTFRATLRLTGAQDISDISQWPNYTDIDYSPGNAVQIKIVLCPDTLLEMKVGFWILNDGVIGMGCMSSNEILISYQNFIDKQDNNGSGDIFICDGLTLLSFESQNGKIESGKAANLTLTLREPSNKPSGLLDYAFMQQYGSITISIKKLTEDHSNWQIIDEKVKYVIEWSYERGN